MMRLIVALDRQRGLAKKGGMPWNIPDDEAYFTNFTKQFGGIVLVGHGTYKTFHGPLKDRQNYVLTHQTEPIPGTTLVNDLDQFFKDFRDKDVWVVGGAAVFAKVMEAGKADELYLTHIDADFGCDQFFPAYEDGYVLIDKSEPQEQNGFTFSYAKYSKQP